MSWHLFTGDADDLARGWLADHGAVDVELVLSEWNAVGALRGTPFQLGLVADLMRRASALGIAHETIAAWEDFTMRPPGDDGDYGLLRQDCSPKAVFAVHEAFDRLSRDAVATSDIVSGRIRACAARDGGGRLRFVVWQLAVEPRFAGVGVLRDAIASEALEAAYLGRSAEDVIADIRAGAAPRPEWAATYSAAREALLAAEAQQGVKQAVTILLPQSPGAAVDVVRIAAGSIGAPQRLPLDGTALRLVLDPNEVVSVELRVSHLACHPARSPNWTGQVVHGR